jgi:nitroreductase
MQEFLNLIQDRQSTRAPFDLERPIVKQDLMKILEAARWSPTPHNMQNFEIIVVDDKNVLKKMGNIKSSITVEFLRENYHSFHSQSRS